MLEDDVRKAQGVASVAGLVPFDNEGSDRLFGLCMLPCRGLSCRQRVDNLTVLCR